MTFGLWIVAGAVAGGLSGLLLPAAGQHAGVVMTILLRVMSAVMAPLLFATIVRVGGRRAAHCPPTIPTGAVTVLLLFTGFLALELAPQNAMGSALTNAALTSVVPESIVHAAAGNRIPQIIVFSLIFCLAVRRIAAQEPRRAILEFCDGLAETMLKFGRLTAAFLPFGLAAGIAQITAGSAETSRVVSSLLLIAVYAGIVHLMGMYFPRGGDEP